ncbi:hypothetical protein IW492_14950 [Enterococcus sp. BWB1-3]|uniref:hypothetical protein n=1 Tax=Enterococcus sp. BWB1-3 TaxID=2787713 RepID=UPI0019207637|nr:hypothetical protein [Enterococcus sp. BWB1-3]MBL1230527.1 hypothetical protein [Enterococcus sp. BWB1-3]
MDQAITFSNMKLVCSFSYLHIEQLSFVHSLNNHGIMHLCVSIEEKVAKRLLSQSLSNETIQLVTSENKKILFSGMIEKMIISCIKQVWQVEIVIVTSTKNMDIKKRRKSFQDISKSYVQLISEISGDYPASQFIDVNTLSKNLETMILQYDETDWQLIKRLAAINNTFLVADIIDTRPKFWVGLKEGCRIEFSKTKYTFGRNYQQIRQVQENPLGRPTTNKVNQLIIETVANYDLGDYLLKDQEKYFIIKKKCTLVNGQLEFEYKVMIKQGFNYWVPQQKENIGITLEGTVIAVSGTNVKVHLDIDKKQGIQNATWFPYLTEGSNITYYMPEIGSRVKVYFPQENEKKATATLGIRSNISSYRDEMNDPTTKILSNPQGKRISLSSNDLSIISSDRLSITLTDGSNIAINSNSSINIHSAADVSFSSRKSISVTSDSSITLQGKSTSSILIAADIQLSSPDLQYSGGSGVKAIHKTLEGSSQTKRKKRAASTQAIQDLNKMEISQKAISSIPIIDNLSKKLGVIERVAATAVNTIPFTTNQRIIQKEPEAIIDDISQKQDYRAKVSFGTLPIEGSKIVPLRLETTGLQTMRVKPNGNLNKQPDTNVANQMFSQKNTKIEKIVSQNQMNQEHGKAADSKMKIKTIDLNQLAAKSVQLPETNTLSTGSINKKEKRLHDANQPTADREQKEHHSVNPTSKNQKMVSATENQSGKTQTAGGKTNPGTAGSSSGNSASGGGFGVVNKGAVSAISPVAFINAQTNAMIKSANRKVTNKLLQSMSIRQITSGSVLKIANLNKVSTSTPADDGQTGTIISERKVFSGISLQNRLNLKPVVVRPLILNSDSSTKLQSTVVIDSFRKVETTLGFSERNT